MKFRTTTAFDSDFRRLAPEHQKLFLRMLRQYFLPAVDAGAFAGTSRWPPKLRIHRLTSTAIYSVTWNFASPDGRATFHLDKNEASEPILVWRRIGDHGIYDRP